MAEYETDEGKVKEVCSILKAVLTSFGGELPMQQIDAEYKTVVGKSIPFRELKHGSLASFLQSIPDVLKLENRAGRLVVKVVNDPNINMILCQVQGQDNKSNKKNKTIQKKWNPGFGARQLHGTPSNQQFYSAGGQTNANWYPTTWQPPNTTRTKFSYSYMSVPQQAQQIPSFSHQQPRYQSSNTATHNQKAAQPQPPPAKAPPRPEGPKATKQVSEKAPAKKTYKQQLTEAVQALEASQGKINLVFQTLPFGKKMGWCTVVTIGETRASSYPEMKNTQAEAEEAASKKALEKLQRKEVAELPTTTNYDVSVPRVKQLMKAKSPIKRFWWEPLRDMYSEVFKERLPEDWLTTAKDKSNTGLVFDNLCVDKWTVTLMDESQADKTPKPQTPKPQTPKPQTPKPQTPKPQTPKPQTPTPPAQEQQESPRTPSPSPEQHRKSKDSSLPPTEEKLKLPPLNPPPTPTWDVFITCVEATNTVQLLLVGDKYSSMYSELLTEMELYYMEEKNQRPVKELEVGGIYVASHEESWFRVEVLEIREKEAKTKFVDHGDIEIVPLPNLFHLEKQFYSLPPQALRCCLAGLEDAPKEAAFQALMETLPMGKILVARVQRREEPYAIVLFDTSTSEDVNLNEKVFESVAKHLVEPSLPPVGGLAEVYLTHASSSGIVYVQVETKTFKALDDLLKIAKRRTEEMLGEKVEVDLTKLYLARFSKDGEWYRAAPRSSVDPDGTVLMNFVDFGNSEKVPLNNIKGLQKVSPLLAKVPHQALPCCLHNVPADPELRWTERACQRLMDLAPLDTPLLLKVVSERTTNQAASVQLFKRLLPQNELVSINDTLGIDSNLFGEGDSNNNSMEKEVVVSQFRSQESSSTSDANSQSLPSEPRQVGPDSFPPCSPLSLSDIPDVGSYFDVFVTYAANPNNFAVQPWKLGYKFDDMSESMQDYYNDPANLKHVVAIKGGQYCALKHSDDVWYRAKVEIVMEDAVSGVFVDFGDRFYAMLDKVQPLTPEFCTMPCLALNAKLHGIEAANKDWSPEDACRFRELAGSKNLVSVIFGKEMKDDTLYLSLVLIDTSEKIVDIFINQVLVDERRATCQEA
ncbi:tudor domain-containing protein 7B-like isoform X2 [Eriocheir sinensis]|uniref:tudor domain-containing protein 7B-like isoform X2 n=1 Tax=Eriocheir sinensis TaxID=95602 RepID=UPI0021C7FD68|nr:tudor domain-containing protein 7B-like isoform X2 [Eriocheir sinensis]